MNPTLERFGYPDTSVREYEHWAVLLRPVQTTPLSCVIAARASVLSIGSLNESAGAELPRVIRDYEATIRRIVPAEKFNYLALMMVDPNPHFHAIPRFIAPVVLNGTAYIDACYPKPPNVLLGNDIDQTTHDAWRVLLAMNWQGQGDAPGQSTDSPSTER